MVLSTRLFKRKSVNLIVLNLPISTGHLTLDTGSCGKQVGCLLLRERTRQHDLLDTGSGHSMIRRRDTVPHRRNVSPWSDPYLYYAPTEKKHGLLSGPITTPTNRS